jgi:hypothetical protein
VNFLEH